MKDFEYINKELGTDYTCDGEKVRCFKITVLE